MTGRNFHSSGSSHVMPSFSHATHRVWRPAARGHVHPEIWPLTPHTFVSWYQKGRRKPCAPGQAAVTSLSLRVTGTTWIQPTEPKQRHRPNQSIPVKPTATPSPPTWGEAWSSGNQSEMKQGSQPITDYRIIAYFCKLYRKTRSCEHRVWRPKASFSLASWSVHLCFGAWFHEIYMNRHL